MKRVIKDVLPTFLVRTDGKGLVELDSSHICFCVWVVTGQVLTTLLAQKDKPMIYCQHGWKVDGGNHRRLT